MRAEFSLVIFRCVPMPTDLVDDVAVVKKYEGENAVNHIFFR